MEILEKKGNEFAAECLKRNTSFILFAANEDQAIARIMGKHKQLVVALSAMCEREQAYEEVLLHTALRVLSKKKEAKAFFPLFEEFLTSYFMERDKRKIINQ